MEELYDALLQQDVAILKSNTFKRSPQEPPAVPTKKKHDKALQPIVSPANSNKTAPPSKVAPPVMSAKSTY